MFFLVLLLDFDFLHLRHFSLTMGRGIFFRFSFLFHLWKYNPEKFTAAGYCEFSGCGWLVQWQSLQAEQVSLFIQSCNLIKGQTVIWVLFTEAVLRIVRLVYVGRVRSSSTLNSVNLVDYGSSLYWGEWCMSCTSLLAVICYSSSVLFPDWWITSSAL